MPPAPSPVIQRLANRNSVEPGLQRTAATESTDTTKRAQKNFLGYVGCVGCIRKNSINEVINRGVVIGDEPFESRVRAGLELSDQLRFIAAPRYTGRHIRHCVSSATVQAVLPFCLT